MGNKANNVYHSIIQPPCDNMGKRAKKKKILEELTQLTFSSIVRSQEEHNMTM